jgi:hypothetical protein
VVALPNELTLEQQIELVRDFIRENFVDKGMIADFSVHSGHIHDKKDETYPFQDLAIRKENPHAHIQLTARPLNKNGTWCTTKSKKEYILDKNGNKIKLPSGEWSSRKIPAVDWYSSAYKFLEIKAKKGYNDLGDKDEKTQIQKTANERNQASHEQRKQT